MIKTWGHWARSVHRWETRRKVCWLAWSPVVFLLLTGVHSQAGPVLNTGNPVGFFTNAAIRLLIKAGYTVGPPNSTSNLLVANLVGGVPVTSLNIPIWPTNFYTPSVHRLLQLAANLYDATTNRTDNGYPATYPCLPTVFRPVFLSGAAGKSGSSQITIVGYQEVTPADTAPLLSTIPPHDLSDPSDNRLVKPLDMVYNIPLVVGAKKGLPNFNEFAAQTTIQVTRKLQFRRPNNTQTSPITEIAQMFIVGVSNQFGFEAWNSYAANYPRQVQVYAYPDFGLIITNLETRKWLNGPPMQSTFRRTPPPVTITANGWAGYDPRDQYYQSFQVPFSNNIVFLTNSTYRSPNSNVGNPDQFVGVSTAFEGTLGSTNLHVPRWSVTLRTRLRFAVVDGGRIVDYVNLAAQTTLDLTDALMRSDWPNVYACDPGATRWTPCYSHGCMWCTNQVAGRAGDMFATFGILNQIDASFGHGNPDWNSAVLDAPPGMDKASAITFFQNQFIPNRPHTNLFNAPFQPYRNIYLVNIWRANDPLVHYTVGDLTDLMQTNRFEVNDTTPTANLGRLNGRYEPWGGRPGSPGNIVPPYDLTFKDPVARQFATSDDWDFPTNQTSGGNWLGRVHRGTPWQTIYLKAPGPFLWFWLPWMGYSQLITNFGQLSTSLVPLNGVIYDAFLSQPTNDWRLASMLASLLGTNDPRRSLSVNQATFPAWLGALDGMVVLTNNEGPLPPDGLASLVMSSNSPQAKTIAAAILRTRASRPNQSFQDPGGVLLTPELSVASPWLDTNNAAQYYASLTDEAYEAIPSQLLPLLRADSVGFAVQNGGTLQLQFSGSDGLGYAVQVSSDLLHWTSLTTNYPLDGAFSFVDVPPPGAARRFYRSLLLP